MKSPMGTAPALREQIYEKISGILILAPDTAERITTAVMEVLVGRYPFERLPMCRLIDCGLSFPHAVGACSGCSCGGKRGDGFLHGPAYCGGRTDA